MKILYIDTCTNFLNIAIVEDDKLLIENKLDLGKNLSVYSTYYIDEMYKKINLEPNDIDLIMVVNGPGSFTGIRIGVTIAKILAYSLNKKITTITSLEAMSTYNTDKIIVPLIDARRGYYFASAILNNDKIIEEQYIKLEDILSKLKQYHNNYLIIGNNLKNIDYIEYDPNILEIVKKYKNKDTINPHIVNPVYLKLTEAEENKMVSKND